MPWGANHEAGSGRRASRRASRRGCSAREQQCEESGEAGGVRSETVVPGRADGVGRVEGKAAGFGGVGKGSLGIPRAHRVGLLPPEGIGRSAVSGEGPLWNGATATTAGPSLAPSPATVSAPLGSSTENKTRFKYILISQPCGVPFSLGAPHCPSDLDP